MPDPRTNLDAATVRAPCDDPALSELDGGLCSLPCRFAGYELLEEVARGGMGVVFRARQMDLNRIVAVKMVIDGSLADADDIQRFQAEAESAANLDHPGIVPIYEVGESGGRHFFSMAFIRGDSLANRLLDGPLPAREAARVVADVAEAVEYAHQQGVIHRDLKPANVLLDEQQRPRITDFGVAKRMRTDSDLTIQGELLGTPNYMPPEQARGETQLISLASDVYSLGAILYTAITGRPPFQSANQYDTLNQVIHDQVTPPRQLNSQVPLDLETITLKCLEKQPSRRYETAREVAEELRSYLAGKAIRARPPGILRQSATWFRNNMLVASMSGVTSVALIVGLAGLAWRCRVEIVRSADLETEVMQLRDRVDVNSLQSTISMMHQSELQQLWRKADSERLALLAERFAATDPSLALLLAVEACNRLPESRSDVDITPLAEITLRQLLQSAPDGVPDDSRPTSELTAEARKLAGRTLTDAEQEQFIKLPK